MIPPVLDPTTNAPRHLVSRAGRTDQNRDHNPAIGPGWCAPDPGAVGGSMAAGPTVCQPQLVHMPALRPGLHVPAGWGGPRVVLFI